MGSSDRLRAPGAAFLLSQLGFQSSRLWRERLDPLGLDPREVAVLRYVASSEGQSQRAIGNAMRVPASRMVALVDALERRTLVERRPRVGDRRTFALFLTREGRQLLGKITEVSAHHEAELCAGLTPAERRRLIALLSRLVAEQHLPVGVHPGVGRDWAGRGKRGVRARRPRE